MRFVIVSLQTFRIILPNKKFSTKLKKKPAITNNFSRNGRRRRRERVSMGNRVRENVGGDQGGQGRFVKSLETSNAYNSVFYRFDSGLNQWYHPEGKAQATRRQERLVSAWYDETFVHHPRLLRSHVNSRSEGKWFSIALEFGLILNFVCWSRQDFSTQSKCFSCSSRNSSIRIQSAKSE